MLGKMTTPRILHIAPANTSGVPGQFVQAERRLGFDSRLVTLFNDRRGYFSDICLNLPFIDTSIVRHIKRFISDPDKLLINNLTRQADHIPVTWTPHSRLEALFVKLRDGLWAHRIDQAIRTYHLDRYEVIQLDGGLGLFRNASFVLNQKKRGCTIICCYTGSDLRARGVIPDIDAISDLNVTVEFDHLRLHPDIHHVPFPFDASLKRWHDHHKNTRPVCIGHAPTNRAAKGSDLIIPILRQLEREKNTETRLIENMPYAKALDVKQRCDVFVDQIGDLGYGINALEALAMGVPVLSCLADGFAERYPHHPFIQVNADNLYERLLSLIDDYQYRRELAEQGAEWVREIHDAVQVVKRIHKLAGIG